MLRLTLILPLLFAMLVRTVAAQTQVAAVPFIQWQKFVDPNEGSFWMEVPSGWRISGGLARRNALQFWPWLTAVSPDGDTIIAFGDPNLQSYVLPTPSLAAAGFREGSLYSGGGGTLYVVRRYVPGRVFAKDYGQQQLPRFCADLQVTSVDFDFIGPAQLPDLVFDLCGIHKSFFTFKSQTSLERCRRIENEAGPGQAPSL